MTTWRNPPLRSLEMGDEQSLLTPYPTSVFLARLFQPPDECSPRINV